MRAVLTYPGVGAFYASDPARRRSPEIDFGGPWRTVAFGPTYRAAWLSSTGELFVVRLGSRASGGGTVEVLAHVPEIRVLAEMLSGWQRVCGSFDSIRWLRARIATAHPLKRRHGWGLQAAA
ncbi:MAG: hypothetical protein QOD81_2569 [Solirubrobacteraceae bacterium]|jgi:hypothetical protein|nr:hypothetical protein [Solirubrobacteraceae bacterium]